MNVLSFFKLQFILWIFPVAIIIQNIEVSYHMIDWLKEYHESLPIVIKNLIYDINEPYFKDLISTSLFISSMLPMLAVAFFNRTDSHRFFHYLLCIVAFMVITGIFIKMAMVLIFQSYFPGVVVAIIISFPVSYRLIKYCFDSFQFNLSTKLSIAFSGFLLIFPVTWFVLKIARFFVIM